MTIAEQIYSIVKNLPQEQASEILAFAEFIRSKHTTDKGDNSKETPETIDTAITPLPWTEFVYTLAGTWADDFPSLDKIRAEEGQDVFRESL